MSEAKSSTVRNPAIELYRVVLMFLIVLHHAAYHGYWNHIAGLDRDYPSLFIFFTAFVVWHVDGFLSITGWFGTRFSLSRFVKLWGIITVYSVASIMYGYLSNGRISYSNRAGGWFGETYMFFLFLTPLLNPALQYLAQDKRRLFVAWLIFDCGLFLNWIPTHLFTSVASMGTGPFTVMTFIAVYVNVRILKLSGIAERVSKTMIAWVALLFFAGITSVALVRTIIKTYFHGSPWNLHDYASELDWLGWYDAPHVIIMAIAGLLFFAKYVTVPRWISKQILAISPLMFGVYLCHETTAFGRLIYRIPQSWMANHLGWHPMIIVLITALACFVICIAAEYMRQLIAKPIVNHFMPKIQALDKRIGL